MRVTFLTTSYPRNAQDHASVFVHGLARAVAQTGVEVTVVVPHEKGLAKTEVIEGVRVERFRYFWPQSLQQVAYGFGVPDNLRYKFWAKVGLPFFLVALFCRALRATRNCDVIHSHWEFAGLAGLLAARLWRKPVVLTVHRLVKRGWLTRRLSAFLLPRMDALHFNSSFTQEEAREFVGERPGDERIYQSIDFSFFEGGRDERQLHQQFHLSANRTIILGLGRLVEKKGFPILIEAYSRLQKEWPEDQLPILIIAGGGPLEEMLRQVANQSCRQNSVFFTGFVLPAAIRTFLREATILAMPSIVDSRGEVETLGVVAIEALASGCPVVASRVGGLPDAIMDGETGLLVAPGDVPALTEAMMRLLRNPDLRQRLSAAGKKRVKEIFTWERAAQRTLASYQSLARKKGGPV